jgi:hypothetical protein
MFATIVFALTGAMILVHVGEWVLLGKMAGAAAEARPGPALRRAAALLNLLRLEVVYYLVLLVFWWLNRDAVPAWAVLGLGVAHLGGWAALERKKLLRKLEEGAAGPGGGRLRKVLAGFASFDAIEVMILLYLAGRLWPG